MKYKKLGSTDIDVSLICLGTMTWGQQNTEADAHEQLNYSVEERGINFIDTAEIYPIPPTEDTQGRTETYIGNWLKKRGKRDDLIIASKVVGRSGLNYMRKGRVQPRLSREHIFEAIEGSLERLQTDYIDLYQMHWPDRNTNYFGVRDYKHNPADDPIEIEETLDALKDLVDQGKIRHVGVSNERAWGVMEYLRVSGEKGLPRIQSIQNTYNLAIRDYERDLAEISMREQVGLLAYSPLSMGVLTGKYLGGNMPEGSRFHFSERNSERYNPLHAQPAIQAYVDLARNHGLDPAQMALAFVNSREFVNATIIGATTMDQLKTDIDSIDIELEQEVLDGIETIHSTSPNPCP